MFGVCVFVVVRCSLCVFFVCGSSFGCCLLLLPVGCLYFDVSCLISFGCVFAVLRGWFCSLVVVFFTVFCLLLYLVFNGCYLLYPRLLIVVCCLLSVGWCPLFVVRWLLRVFVGCRLLCYGVFF